MNTLKRFLPLTIIIIIFAVGIVLGITQYKSYHVIKEQTLTTTSSYVEIPFIIEKADKPWKIQIKIQSEYGDVHVSLLTAQDDFLWSEILYEGTYEYSFSNTGHLKFIFHVQSYSIIQRHEGYITVESEVGVGSTFYIYLPAVMEKEKVEDSGGRIKSFKKGAKILLMDDEEVIRDVAGRMLKRLGYKVEFANSWAEVIDKYKKAYESGDGFDAV